MINPFLAVFPSGAVLSTNAIAKVAAMPECQRIFTILVGLCQLAVVPLRFFNALAFCILAFAFAVSSAACAPWPSTLYAFADLFFPMPPRPNIARRL